MLVVNFKLVWNSKILFGLIVKYVWSVIKCSNINHLISITHALISTLIIYLMQLINNSWFKNIDEFLSLLSLNIIFFYFIIFTGTWLKYSNVGLFTIPDYNA